jgi:hypothetical protein
MEVYHVLLRLQGSKKAVPRQLCFPSGDYMYDTEEVDERRVVCL